MPVTNADCGVWSLDEVYLKISANKWVQCYSPANDPGQLWMWGPDSSSTGILGQNSVVSRSSPVQVPDSSWSSISISKNIFAFNTAIARKSDGTLWSWGGNACGLLGLNDINVRRSSPAQIPGTSWINVDLGENHAFALKSEDRDYAYWTWGGNANGQQGRNDTVGRSSPVQVTGASWVDISASDHALGRRSDGTLWSWGYNARGKLGLNDTVSRSSPVQIPGTQWTEVSAGQCHSLALKSDGTLWSWGYNIAFNAFALLGDSSTINRSSPVQVPGTQWAEISASISHSMARKSDGTLWVWGSNGFGQLGTNSILPGSLCGVSSPVQVPGTQWTQIAAACGRSLARKSDGTLWTWGSNLIGQLGLNDTVSRSSPVQIPGTQWTGIFANPLTSGSRYSFATKSDGTLWAWGENYNGVLGINNTTCMSSPVQVPGTQWTDVNPGPSFTLARKSDGTLWAWGLNNYTQLGNRDASCHRSSPVQIPGTQWCCAAAGQGAAFGINTVGSLFSWGFNTCGVSGLGLDTGVCTSSPTLVGGCWVDVVGGYRQSAGLKSDGTLWMWGVASCGSLGDNTLVSKSSPVQIPGTQWTDISLGLLSNFARKSDGTLWSWGGNSSGQLGQNDRVVRSSPVQIPGTQWVEISGESICNHVLARKSDGTLWAWGLNTTGQLGDITIVTRSSPVQIPGTQWTEIAAASMGSAARKSDGTLWAWGIRDTTGQNDNIDRSSPVQIPGTQWFDIAMGGNVPTAAARKAV